MTSFWQVADLALLTIALAYGVLHQGGFSLIDWNFCLLVIGIAALVHRLRRAGVTAPPLEPLLAWAVLLAPLYVALQLVPLPLFLLRILSPARADMVARLGAVMQAPTFAALSINSAATLRCLLNISACTLTFLLVRETASRFWQHEPWAFTMPLIGVAAGEAALGILQGGSGSVAHGTYPNKNHFAGFLEMVLPITVASAIAVFNEKRSRNTSATFGALKACGLLSIAGVILIGLMYSLSKMGFAAGLFGLFVIGALSLAMMPPGPKKWVSVAGLGLCGMLLPLALSPNQLVREFERLVSDPTVEGRWPVWRDTLHLIATYPLFGSGMGSYETAFARYQTSNVHVAYTFAHNDYLQIASELGAVGFFVFVGLMLAVLTRAVRAVTPHQEWNARVLGMGCTGAIAAISVHSLVDFNMYMPANALLLAWISGIAVCFPTRAVEHQQSLSHTVVRWDATALACLLIVYASASIAAKTAFRGNVQAERQFCRFGICDTDVIPDAQTEIDGESVAALPIADLLEAVRREPAAPARWCDLGEAMLRAGRLEQARKCFSNALAFGPNSPPVLLRAAAFYHDLTDDSVALAQTSRMLDETDKYDAQVFDWYTQEKVPLGVILRDGLGRRQRAPRAYLSYLMDTENFGDATTVWAWLLSNRYVDDRLAHHYVNVLYGYGQFEAAARSWAAYLGDRANGYLESNWLFNGDFELEPSGEVFDWTIGNLKDDVEVSLDGLVARSGTRSLRIRFGGKENVDYSHTSQISFVTPGVYRFQAFIRAQEITTDQGIGFHILDAERASHLNIRTEQVRGTTDWKRIEQIVRVPDDTKLLVVQVVRPPSLKFDSHVRGTAWIDTVSLTKVVE